MVRVEIAPYENDPQRGKILDACWPEFLPACPHKGDMVVSLGEPATEATVNEAVFSHDRIYLHCLTHLNKNSLDKRTF
jgi:hypothetical protein